MSKKHILQGFEALQKLSDVINAPQGTLAEEMGGFDDACDTLSGSYYSYVLTITFSPYLTKLL